MGAAEQQRRQAAAAVPASPRVDTLPAGPRAPTPPATPSARRTQKQSLEAGGRSGVPIAVVLIAGVLLLMVAGIAASERKLRLTKALVLPASLLSSSSFAPPEQQDGGMEAETEGTLTALLTSAAATLGERLGDEGFVVRPHQPATAPSQLSDGTARGGIVSAPASPPPIPPLPPPKWQLRCAVLNNLVFHIDVMAGWTYAFQSAGCDVTVYQNKHSLGIEAIMSSWMTGRFRKPELFPGEAGDYHIVILPTFRDQHAEFVQYLMQLPRLERQRYFLTQHNPDWLLNHPNVDILQQQLLVPLLQAAQARDKQQAAGTGVAGLPHPLLRVQVVTLAPCVSNYTLQFLRQMAFNITEGHTYTERVGSFRVRSDTGQGAGEDDSEGLKRWIDTAIDIEIPWLSPLVPWQPAAQAPLGAAAVAAEKEVTGARRHLQQQREALWGRLLLEQQDDSSHGAEVEQAEAELGPAAAPPPAAMAPTFNKWWLTGSAPPPPPPLGAEAVALLEGLNRQRTDGGPRHVCIQGKLENSRRNYMAAFEALSHPAVLKHLRDTGERLLLLGHRSKWETVVVPEESQDVVVVLESLPYTMFFDTLSRCRAIMLAFATEEYYAKKSSSTIAMALNVGVPLVAERRTLEAYNFLQPKACFVYDDTIPGTAPRRTDRGRAAGGQGQGGSKKAAGKGKKAEVAKKGQRRMLLGKKEGTKAASEAAHGGKRRRSNPPPPPQQQRHAAEVQQQEPQAGSYSAAILSALRSESSMAARLAVGKLKEEVMEHNRRVAAAFMADTERQHAPEERAADAVWWQRRSVERDMAEDGDGVAGWLQHEQ